ncbi:hypothetical protein TcasGA2_TC008942 [Tribolium castaneum]|uniref:Uncharacterized protein n=1 Tax=Tribolium castaneum TaxID=7070 RepID=D6WQB2_TRICA|nr:hypothetical protein TcasGA2_TC008942 [Tribolium castaneum]
MDIRIPVCDNHLSGRCSRVVERLGVPHQPINPQRVQIPTIRWRCLQTSFQSYSRTGIKRNLYDVYLLSLYLISRSRSWDLTISRTTSSYKSFPYLERKLAALSQLLSLVKRRPSLYLCVRKSGLAPDLTYRDCASNLPALN